MSRVTSGTRRLRDDSTPIPIWRSCRVASLHGLHPQTVPEWLPCWSSKTWLDERRAPRSGVEEGRWGRVVGKRLGVQLARSSARDEVLSPSDRDGFDARAGVERSQEVADVVPHGLDAEVELTRYLVG